MSLLAFWTSLFLILSLTIGETRAQSNFSWSSITPSSNLSWTDCYTTPFQCARLTVPLDYANPAGASAAIALIRLPANVSTEDAEYRGPLLFNPGGPGGDGVSLILARGAYFADIVGPHFDIVSFDPRGVGFSTPGVSWFESDLERVLFDDVSGSKDFNATHEALGLALAKYQVANRLAEERASNVLPYIHTEFTARDMLAIVEAHGRDKLLYWGISYGTLLGTTFATLFPDKIERVILDGVVDADKYYATRWDSLDDADKALGFFFSSCFEAGPDRCPFYADSTDLMQQNYLDISNRLRTQPIPILPVNGTGYGFLDYSALSVFTFNALYFPYVYNMALATILAGLANGDASVASEYYNQNIPTLCEAPDPEFNASAPDMQRTVICNDGAVVPNTYEDAEEYLQIAVNQSLFGGVLASLRLACSGWPKLSQNNFQGPVGANTSFPILFIANEADPITPRIGALRMSDRFPGSVVLSQNFSGHSTLAAPSTCMSSYIRAYFVNGTLPEDGVWCPVDGSPFDEPSSSSATMSLAKRAWTPIH